jgi:uncharacterized protein YkwD
MRPATTLLAGAALAGCTSLLDLPPKQQDGLVDVPEDTDDASVDGLPDVPPDVVTEPGPDVVADTAHDTAADPTTDTAHDTAADPTTDTAHDTAADPTTDTAHDTITDTAVDVPTDGGEVEELCARWLSDRSDLSEGTWTGSVGSCNAGDVTGGGRENALRLVNLYRWIADLPAVTTDPAADAATQECALMMHANGTLSHSPPPSWTCYTDTGASAAGSSNIASGPAVSAVDMYMSDFGNESTMGHRRWILSEGLGPIGIGSTSSYSCMQVVHWPSGGTWTAWPSPGVFPVQAMDVSWVGIDSTGWTLQSNTISLSSASVTVTRGGTPLPVDVRSLAANYGSISAIAFTPDGWTSAAGETYHVEVTGISPTISYDVHMVDCS